MKAFSGAGKTSTLVKYALNNPNERMLYLAFNRAIRDEAAAKFPPNVICKTSHQLAYAVFGSQYRHKLRNALRVSDVAVTLGVNDWDLCAAAIQTLSNFMASEDSLVYPEHCTAKRSRTQATCELASVIWEEMVSQQSSVPMTHDGYLKLYQLSRPNLGKEFTTILFDEAQDSNPVTSSIVLQQQCKVIYVGDDHQQIYRFRGADNALKHPLLEGADRCSLTHSFRFGPKIAFVANAILALKGETTPVVGRRDGDAVEERLPASVQQHAIISRTVSGVIGSAIEAVSQGKRIYWVGGINGYQIDHLEDLYYFAHGDVHKVKNKSLLKEYNDFSDYETLCDSTNDPEMKRCLNILNQYQRLPALIHLLREATCTRQEQSDIIVTTAHRCKGLEWECVVLADDYPDIFSPEIEPEQRIDELNLLYVASTRALQTLVVNEMVKAILRYIHIKARRG